MEEKKRGEDVCSGSVHLPKKLLHMVGLALLEMTGCLPLGMEQCMNCLFRCSCVHSFHFAD